MSADVILHALPWISAIAAVLGLAIAIAVLTSRSLFSVGIGLAAFSACMSVALAALGYGDGAVALALLGGAIAPVLFLAGVLLSGRAVKPRKRGAPWLSLIAGGLAAAAMVWAAPSLGAAQPVAGSQSGAPIALAALVFIAVAACVGLLGYGERGVLGGAREGRDA
jgi:uncharacterized MnhB-related membrane protein